MNRSLSLLSAFALSSAALLSFQPQEAKAMNIAFDCFERSSEKLIARSAVDMTSTAISCLPVPGTTLTDASSIDSGDGVILANHTTTEEDTYFDEDVAHENTYEDDGGAYEDDGGAYEDDGDERSTGSKLGSAVGEHLGKLLGQGISDLFR